METQTLEVGAQTALEAAQSFTITNNEAYVVVDNHCASLAALEKTIKAEFKDPKQKAHDAHKAIVAMEARLLEPIDEARKLDKAKMAAWREYQEKLRQEERTRLEDEAVKKAEGEAAMAAMVAEDAGDVEKAQEILAAPIVINPVYTQTSIPKSHTTIRTAWAARVVDASMVPREYMTPNETLLNGLARNTKGAMKIPGVEFYSRTV